MSKDFKMITAGDAISKSPLNHSKSKQLYSFNRAPRFSDPSKKTDYPMYNLTSWRNNRSTSLGYGTKYDFTKESKDKCGVFYNVAKDMDPKTSAAPAYSFGLGREYFSKVHYDTVKNLDMKVPGPGIYNYLKPFGHGSPKFSLSFRPENIEMKARSKEPGPGEYKHMNMNPKGAYPLSQYHNTPGINFSNYTEKRFNYKEKDKVPGPGSYNIKWLLDGKGFNFISKFRSTGSPSIVGRKPDLSSKFTCMKSKIFVLLYSAWTWNL